MDRKSFGAPMSFRRVGCVAAIALATLLEMSCGDVYRPVVIPTGTTPPNPANYHTVFGVSTNATGNPGTALQIDVSGDTNVGEANMGLNPTHAGILPNNSRVFVASAGSLAPGQSDVITSFSPASPSPIVTGLGNPILFTLPTIGTTFICQYKPDYLTTTQTSVMYVANFGGTVGDPNCNRNSTDSVAVLNTQSNAITNIAYLPAGSRPVAMAETPNALNLYVINQGNDTVADLSPTDMSTIATIQLPAGSTPVWAVARPDSQRVYVVTQGDGNLYTINTATNAASAGQSVGGAGANFLLYDKSRNRLYVVNPVAQAVYVFDATADPPAPITSISMSGANSPCPNGCTPVSVAALPDGSRFYVASYQTALACPDPTLGSSVACVIPMVTVFDARSFLVKPAIATSLPGSSSLSLLSAAQFSVNQYAVPEVLSCVATGPYAPGQTRFRMFATAAADSSHVYVSVCDAGTIADIVTTTSSIATGGSNTPDVLTTDITAPAANCSGANCGFVAAITGFQIASGVVTFTAANGFTPGQQVRISGLTSSTGTLLNGENLTVIATGLSATQFECNLPPSFAPSSAPNTGDTGSAVPLPPPQNPIFLLTGQ